MSELDITTPGLFPLLPLRDVVVFQIGRAHV